MSWEERYAQETERAWQEKHRVHGRLREVGYPSHDESREALPLRSNGIFQDQTGETLETLIAAPAARAAGNRRVEPGPPGSIRLYGAAAVGKAKKG